MGLGIVRAPKSDVTVERLKELFPKKKGTITEETAALINAANSDPSFNSNEFVEQMISYRALMENGGYSMKEYITALKFCAYLESEEDNYTEAYKRARSSDEWVMARADAGTETLQYRELTSAASRYRKNPLVKKILTECDMPLYLMFQGARYKAVAQLEKEMTTAAYSRDRISAADKLLTHVKPPDDIKLELEVGMNAEARSATDMLNEQLMKVAMGQRAQLDAGMSITDVQKLKISTEKIEDAEIVDGE